MKYELDLISPVHIGSGGFISPIEFIVDDKFYRADMDKLFRDERFDTDGFIENAKAGAFYLGEFASELAKEHVRYSLNISESTRADLHGLISRRSSEVREFTKTNDEAYLPGSSIKGSIRTAILWWVLKHDHDKFNRAKSHLVNLIRSRDIDKKHVDDKIVHDVFGKEPTHDLLKALQVSDTNAITSTGLSIEEVRTLTTTPQGHNWKSFYTFVEALKPRTKFDLEMEVDDFLLDVDAARELHFEGKQNLVRELPKICDEFADDLIKNEIEFFEQYNTPRELDEVLKFYERLIEERGANTFLLHLSWGSGWHGMTVGRLLEPHLLSDLRRKFRLGKVGVPEFPKTRRLVHENGKPKYPLGWVKLRVL